ncbi:hypothetical protein F2P81_015133 [Scophthalmus maximus]|uniref:Uncharacterized protein n=1 Tax=Scophthalmus maximus TaxID=52904 RepID=A0A6A4SFA8_SCOMX|nr:hypothetical protein F2P81_015133 [Scophthalmus maximus]
MLQRRRALLLPPPPPPRVPVMSASDEAQRRTSVCVAIGQQMEWRVEKRVRKESVVYFRSSRCIGLSLPLSSSLWHLSRWIPLHGVMQEQGSDISMSEKPNRSVLLMPLLAGLLKRNRQEP